MLKTLLTSFILVVILLGCKQPSRFEKTDDAVIVHLDSANAGVGKVRVQVISDDIIRVTATPRDTFSTASSLMVLEEVRPVAQGFTVDETENEVLITTGKLTATVSKKTGEVKYADRSGKTLLQEKQKAADSLTLYVYTGRDGAFQLYEDEGTNYNYEKSQFSTVQLSYNEQSKTLTIGERKGSFKDMLKSRAFRIIWVSTKEPQGLSIKNTQPGEVVQYTGEEISIKRK